MIINTAILNTKKLRTVAQVAKFFVDTNFEGIEIQIAGQMVNEGIRKMHDAAKSIRGNGKYLGHPCWSRKALAKLKANGGTEKGIERDLRHEHAFPISCLIKEILFVNPRETNVATYEEQIRERSHVVIITKEEDCLLSKTMPSDWQKCGPLARYELVGLISEIVCD